MHIHSYLCRSYELLPPTPLTYQLCELDSILFIPAFESGSAGAYLVETNDVILPVVLKILTQTDFLLHTDEEMFSFGARLAAMYREINVLMMI
jgi:hypothetical protein